MMKADLERVCDQHAERSECPDALVRHEPGSSRWSLYIHDGGRSGIEIFHCPWCGAQLKPTQNKDTQVRVSELTDLPAAESCCSKAEVFMYGSDVMVVYEVSEHAINAGHPAGWALAHFEDCRRMFAGGPNDEAFCNHPVYVHGLQCYTMQEVVNSPLIDEQHAILHADGAAIEFRAGMRHFVLSLKESTIDVFADRYRLLGVYTSQRSAWNAAMDKLIGTDPHST